MTLHKLNPEAASAEIRPLSVSLSFQHDFYDLGEAVFKTRALQAFENAASRYAIHRLARCAVRRSVEATFDDLALNSGLAAQRLDRGTLLLESTGLFVHADGRQKAGYCSCTFNVWADSKERAQAARSTLLQTVGERIAPEEMFVIDWQFSNARGSLSSASFEEVFHEVLHDEAYPTLGEPVRQFVHRYLNAKETVLVLQGSPGTGKTRLVRSVLGAMSHRKGISAEIMYTADKRTLENDEIFVEFITGDHDAFVIEDADHMLMARTNGNHDLHRFLAIADGVVRAQGRKIIFTTNLPNIGDLDEALLRPGRCFQVIRTRLLNCEEVDRLIARVCPDDPHQRELARANCIPAGTRSVSVAEVYRACERASAELRPRQA
jgi:ATPase family associated with various cellular activities (AAA)